MRRFNLSLKAGEIISRKNPGFAPFFSKKLAKIRVFDGGRSGA
jgi:hypothetical protein